MMNYNDKIGDPVQEGLVKEGSVAYLPNTVFEESLPKKFVFYPGFYGFSFAFSDKRDGELFFCECSKEALRKYFEISFVDYEKAKGAIRHNMTLSLKYLPYQVLVFIKKKKIKINSNTYKFFNYKSNLCHICNKKIPKLQYCNPMYGGKFVRMYGWYINQLRWEMGLPKFDTKFDEIDKEKYPDELKEVIEEIPEGKRLSYWSARGNPFRFDIEAAKKSDSDWGVFQRQLSNYFENQIRLKLGYKKVGEAWVTETSLYYMIKNLYPNLTIIYHYRPKFLGGLELDIFIKEQNIGIEYQGIQHFKPIDYWGGKESFGKGKKRDAKKKYLCKKHGVQLYYFNYDEDITESLVKSRLKLV